MADRIHRNGHTRRRMGYTRIEASRAGRRVFAGRDAGRKTREERGHERLIRLCREPTEGGERTARGTRAHRTKRGGHAQDIEDSEITIYDISRYRRKKKKRKIPYSTRERGIGERFSEISRDRYFDISKLFSRKSGYRDIETDYRESGIILLLRSLRPQRWGCHRWWCRLRSFDRSMSFEIVVLAVGQRTSQRKRLGKRS